jgi:hypothetical protein
MKECSPQMKQGILKFACGTEKIPLDGLEPPFTLTLSSAPASSLPKAHTCFNQLVKGRVSRAVFLVLWLCDPLQVLPAYPSKDALRDKLLYTVQHAGEGFELT